MQPGINRRRGAHVGLQTVCGAGIGREGERGGEGGRPTALRAEAAPPATRRKTTRPSRLTPSRSPVTASSHPRIPNFKPNFEQTAHEPRYNLASQRVLAQPRGRIFACAHNVVLDLVHVLQHNETDQECDPVLNYSVLDFKKGGKPEKRSVKRNRTRATKAP